MKALYKHKKSGDIFAIETEVDLSSPKASPRLRVLNTSGPLLTKDLNPDVLDYDDYWNTKIPLKQKNFCWRF